MSEEKTMTAHDAEMIVLASMIAPETAKAANKAIKAAKFKPEDFPTATRDALREYFKQGLLKAVSYARTEPA